MVRLGPKTYWSRSSRLSYGHMPSCSFPGVGVMVGGLVGGITKATYKHQPIPCLGTTEDCAPDPVLGPYSSPEYRNQ